MRELKRIIFLFLMISSNAYAYSYTCVSDFVHKIHLDSSSNIYPSKGAVYQIDFDNHDTYVASCDVPSSGLTKSAPTLYKAVYGQNYPMDNEGYAVLNDFVKVKTYIKIYQQGNVVVPFTDVSNNYNEIPQIAPNVASGSSGQVDVLIQKSILQGTITVPEFYVYLYSRYDNYSTGYNEKPLSIVHFRESTLDVDKVCDFSNIPLTKTIKNKELKSLLANSNSMGDFELVISCNKNVSDLDLKLSFSGIPYQYDNRFYQSDVDTIGVGIYKDQYIYGDSGYSFKLNNSQARISFDIIPFLKDKKTVINSDVNLNIKPIIYEP